MEILSNQSFIGFVTLSTLIFTALTCFFAYPAFSAWWKRKKHSKWIVLRKVASIQLIDDNIEKFKEISITYKNDKDHLRYSKTLALFKGTIVNVGEQDVLKDDFQSTLSIRLSKEATFVEMPKWFEVRSRQSNKASNAALSIPDDASGIDIAFDILKPGDSVDFEALLSISSQRIEKVFDYIEIQNGIKGTVVEKQKDEQKKPAHFLGLTEYTLFSFLTLIFCTSVLGKFYEDNKSKVTQPRQQVFFLSSDGIKYSANYEKNLVLLKCVDTQNTHSHEDAVLFQSDFEKQYKPILDTVAASDSLRQTEQSPIAITFIWVIIAIFFLAYALSATVFILSLLRVFWDFLKNTFFVVNN